MLSQFRGWYLLGPVQTHDYSEHQETQSPEDLQRLNAMVDQLDAAELITEQLEIQLKEAKARASVIRENDIPELMQSIGLKEIVTAKGLKVSIREEVRASFFAKDPSLREPAYAWLRENHHDGLIKSKVELQFNREQEELCAKVVEHLKAMGVPLNMSQKKEIHPQTLLAFLREQLREGVGVPLEKFGAFVQKFAKIDRPK